MDVIMLNYCGGSPLFLSRRWSPGSQLCPIFLFMVVLWHRCTGASLVSQYVGKKDFSGDSWVEGIVPSFLCVDFLLLVALVRGYLLRASDDMRLFNNDPERYHWFLPYLGLSWCYRDSLGNSEIYLYSSSKHGRVTTAWRVEYSGASVLWCIYSEYIFFKCFLFGLFENSKL